MHAPSIKSANALALLLPLIAAACSAPVEGGDVGAEDVASQASAYTLPTMHKDFDSSGSDDVLWYSPSQGIVSAWDLSGTTVQRRQDLSWTVPGTAGWQAKGTGDFNNDGHTDVLWYHPASGVVSTWLLDGTGKVTTKRDISWTVPGTGGWQLAGTGDFNRDGNLDLLWYSPSTGVVSTWLLNGAGGVLRRQDINWTVPGSAGWQLSGTGDFNGDGNVDLLWYSPSTGVVSTWIMQGTTVLRRQDLSWTVPGSAGWQLAGTGDYNLDGSTDVLWYSPSTGVVSTWIMQGTTVLRRQDLSWTVPGSAGWQLVSR